MWHEKGRSWLSLCEGVCWSQRTGMGEGTGLEGGGGGGCQHPLLTCGIAWEGRQSRVGEHGGFNASWEDGKGKRELFRCLGCGKVLFSLTLPFLEVNSVLKDEIPQLILQNL